MIYNFKKIDKDINDLWCSLWPKNSNSPSGMHFDEVKEKELASQLLEMINKLLITYLIIEIILIVKNT